MPRKPSETLKQRIFAPSATTALVEVQLIQERLNFLWINCLRRFALMGASLALVAVFGVFQVGSTLSLGSTEDIKLASLLSASLSNQSYSSYLQPEQIRRNTWSAPMAFITLEATNPVGMTLAPGGSTGADR